MTATFSIKKNAQSSPPAQVQPCVNTSHKQWPDDLETKRDRSIRHSWWPAFIQTFAFVTLLCYEHYRYLPDVRAGFITIKRTKRRRELTTGLKHMQPQQPDAPTQGAHFKPWPCNTKGKRDRKTWRATDPWLKVSLIHARRLLSKPMQALQNRAGTQHFSALDLCSSCENQRQNPLQSAFLSAFDFIA